MKFNEYPYRNLTDLNLDHILNAIREMRYEVTNFVSINAIKYANPIQWSIIRQYEKNTIVIDPVTGSAYISVAPVPAGVALTRPEYWTVVFDLSSFIVRAAKNFTNHYESDTTLTATFPTNAGGWLVWGDTLYKALVNITTGDQYVIDSNIEHFTIEDLYNAYLQTIDNILAMVGSLIDLNTADKTSIVNAINSVLTAINIILGFANENENENFSQAYTAGTIIIWYGRLFSVNDDVIADSPIAGNVTATDIAGVITSITSMYNNTNSRINNVLGFPNENENENFSQPYSEGNLILWYGTIFEVSDDVLAGDPIEGNVRQNDLAGIITAIYNAIDNKIDKTDLIIITASYGTTPSLTDNFLTYIEPLLVPSVYKHMYTGVASGAGFVYYDTKTYLELLQDVVTENDDAVSDIIVIGTGNDVNTPDADFLDAIKAFAEYAKVRFKNAKIRIAPVSSNPRFADHKANAHKYTIMMENVANYDVTILPYSYNVLATSYQQYLSPTLHPTTAGAKFLAMILASDIISGSYNYYHSIPLLISEKWLLSDSTLGTGAWESFTDKDGLHVNLRVNFTRTVNTVIGTNQNFPTYLLDTSGVTSSIIDGSFQPYYLVSQAQKLATIVKVSDGTTSVVRVGFFYDSTNDRFCLGVVAPYGQTITLSANTEYSILLKDTFSFYEF